MIPDGKANPLMDRKVVGAVFFGVVAMVAVVTWSVTSPTGPGPEPRLKLPLMALCVEIQPVGDDASLGRLQALFNQTSQARLKLLLHHSQSLCCWM